MKTNEIKEGNRLIAEFMGMEWFKNYWIIDNDVTRTLRDLKYHYDWNWLMEVVEKITHEFPDYDDTDEMESILDTLTTCNLEHLWLVTVEFIKWYNNQKH